MTANNSVKQCATNADLQTCAWVSQTRTSVSQTSTPVSQTSTPVSQNSTSVRLFRLAISDVIGNIYKSASLQVCSLQLSHTVLQITCGIHDGSLAKGSFC